MDYLSLAGVVLGIILIFGYILYASWRRTPVQMANAAILFVAASGFVAGVRVFMFGFNPELILLVKKEGIDISHVLLGGIALCWISVLSAYGALKSSIRGGSATPARPIHAVRPNPGAGGS